MFVLLFFTTKSGLREESSSSAGVEPGDSVHADDVQLGVLGHGEPGEGEEPLGQGRQFLIGWTSEVTQSSRRIATSVLHQQIWPVTGVDTVVIG